MHLGPLAFLRLYWFRIALWLRVGVSAGAIVVGILLHIVLATVLGCLALVLSSAQIVVHARRRRGRPHPEGHGKRSTR